MAQLYYRYSTMNAGKSIELIKVAYNYEERGKTVMTLTPSVDDRFGEGIITSRIGIQREAIAINDDTNILELFIKENEKHHIDCVLVDECQFLKKHHVLELVEIVDSFEVPVLAYGLKNDFKNELFEGSYYMLVYADKIEEINEKQTNKYVLVKTTENIEGKMEKETIEVVYYYKKVEAQVIVKHVDEETGEEIAEREYIGGYVGDRYTTREKEIEGYEVVIERIPKNKEGNMEEEVIEVIYYYKKIPKVENIDTGDIAVYAVASVAVICVIGIIYVIIKNRKKNK